MGRNNRKAREGVVYSTNQSFDYEIDDDDGLETLAPSNQKLKVFHDRKQRKGKTATLITGFVGSEDDLKDLAKKLKSHCGVGGSVKNKEVIIQGELRDKVFDWLIKNSYKAKKSGG